MIKYQGKHLLLFHNTNNKVNKFCIDSINKHINHTYYFFDDINNIKDFDPDNIKMDEK